MDIERIKKIIVDQRDELDVFFQKEKIIPRETDMKKLKKYLSRPNILVITGPRRCGKSTLAAMVFEKETRGYLNFDDERLAGFSAEDFDKALEAFYELYGENLDCFIFDEIQNIDKWELFVSRLRRTKKIAVTGSNAKLLSGDLATHLTGRYLEEKLYPFSFREFLKYKNFEMKKEDFYSTKRISQIKRLLKEYAQNGGFPEALKFGPAMAKKVYEDVIAKDILLRYGVKNKKAFSEMANYVISNFAGEINYRKLGNVFSIKNVHTVKNYVDYLAKSYLIFIVEKFSFKLKQQFITSKKTYGIDTGLINSVAFQSTENTGKIMENMVFLDLKRRADYYESDMSVYYWQDYQGKEIDFAVKKGNKIIQLIQVCDSLNSFDVKERETRSFIKAGKELNCGNFLIITASEEGVENINGKKIKVTPLWKWLLKQ